METKQTKTAKTESVVEDPTVLIRELNKEIGQLKAKVETLENEIKEKDTQYEEAVKINNELNERNKRLFNLLSNTVDLYVSNK